ncbi:hypothetical protein [Curtobacterium flaccumfaciens]|jgi:hypothetical protein|uniref:hypothetical protein n=1 Tax=Curtobacterium flaccumfaciens TaxID=2035 RepID=UPI001266A1BF|nr:hypothetical protein [Curtobacterium flaccumfaciens]MBT1665638.1 hypothetical protein [Curtobacterium flaccumfaciens pv. flaccumfaciens]QFS80058.1 hypothetical protein GBG65_13170 [Curtobacterium flaccumfaciens pv. flaccumfaciens]
MTNVPDNYQYPNNGQPNPYQPPHGHIPDQHRRGNPFGLVALIVGIVAIVGCAIPIINNVSIVLGVIAVIFAIVGLIVKYRRRGLAIAGLVLGVLSVVVGLSTQALYSSMLDGVGEAFSSASAESFDKEHTVTIKIEGDSTDANLTYTTDGGSEEVANPKLPFSKEFTVTGSTFGSATVTNGQSGTTVTCTVSIDGEQVSTNTSSGEYASASCDYDK